MAKWIEKKVSDFLRSPIGEYCPSVLFYGAPARDEADTTNLRNPFRVIGCRGITCKECWNSEEGEFDGN